VVNLLLQADTPVLVQPVILWYSPFVAHTIGEKWSKLALLACLTLALVGSSAISTGEALCFELSNNDSLSPGRYYSTIIGHTVDWLAGNILTIKKPHDYSGSLPRSKLLRVFAFAGTIVAALCPAGVKLNIKHDTIPILTNPVLTKLRI